MPYHTQTICHRSYQERVTSIFYLCIIYPVCRCGDSLTSAVTLSGVVTAFCWVRFGYRFRHSLRCNVWLTWPLCFCSFFSPIRRTLVIGVCKYYNVPLCNLSTMIIRGATVEWRDTLKMAREATSYYVSFVLSSCDALSAANLRRN